MSEQSMLIFNILDLFHNFLEQIYNIKRRLSSPGSNNPLKLEKTVSDAI